MCCDKWVLLANLWRIAPSNFGRPVFIFYLPLPFVIFGSDLSLTERSRHHGGLPGAAPGPGDFGSGGGADRGAPGTVLYYCTVLNVCTTLMHRFVFLLVNVFLSHIHSHFLKSLFFFIFSVLRWFGHLTSCVPGTEPHACRLRIRW